MVLRIAATGLAIGLMTGLCGAGPALAEPAETIGADLAKAVLEAASLAPGPTAICQRNARVEALPAAALIDLYARHIATRTYILNTENGSDLSNKADVVIAEQRALLPETAQDLPPLMLLAKYEASGNPVMALVLSSETALLPEMSKALERQGLTKTLRALRLMQASIPEWIKPEASWVGVYADAPSPDKEADLATAKAAIEAAARLYPPGSARAAAIAIIEKDPALMARIMAILTMGDKDTAMYWLLDQLWTNCTRETSSAEETESAFAALGTPQTAILLLDTILLEISEGTLEYYFIGPPGDMIPATARVLEIRGLTAEAEALRTGMALFGTPFPRMDWARAEAMNAMTNDQLAQLAALSDVFDEEVLWAEMTLIAREAGLLPGSSPTPQP